MGLREATELRFVIDSAADSCDLRPTAKPARGHVRQQHYRFAHQILMNAVLRDPVAWFSNAATHGNAMLQEAWAAAGAGLGPQDCADGSSLSIAPMAPAPGVEALVITLPAPVAPTECYFVAIVRVGGNAPRYFVAERGVDGEGGAQRAYWAEWKQSPAGVMRIRGADLPAITPDALVIAAVAEVNSSPPQNAPGQGMPGAAPWQGGPGAAQWPQNSAPAPKKKSNAPLIIGCGCIAPILFVLIVGGFILYQEELRGLHVPDTEVASVPVQPDVPFTIKFNWNGTGYAFNNVWLVVDEGTKSGGRFEVSGKLSCSRGSRPQDIKASLPGYAAHKVEEKGGDGFSGWIYLGDEYERSSSRPIECGGVVKPVTGTWTKARIVVTQRQRPSDWIAN